MILLHIIIALSSLVSAGLVFLFPSQLKLNISYVFVALTLITGFDLVLSKPTHLTQTCIEGLVYLGVVSLAIVSARKSVADGYKH